MADEQRQILIDVEVENKDFDKEIGNVNKELEENKKLIRELKKDYSANSTEIAKLEARNRELTQSKRQLIKEQGTEANSLDALRLKLAKLTKERNSANTSTEEGAAAFDRLQKEIKETSDEISEFEQEGGDFRRNVGNYPELLDNATGGFVTMFRTILANPIGLLIAALTGLVTVFAKTQTGAEFFRKTGALLNTVLGKLSDIVEELGGNLIEAFQDPRQALIDFADLIQEAVVNYFTKTIPNAINRTLEGFGLLGQAFSKLIKGEFSEAADIALDGIGKIADGVTDLNPVTFVYKKLTEQIIDFAIEANEAANTAFDLETAMIANEKAMADLAVRVAKNRVEFIKLKTASDDINLSYKERIEAAQAAFDLENRSLSEQIKLQQQRVDLLKAQNDLTNSTEEDIQRVRDAEIQLFQLQEQSLNMQLEVRNKLNGLIQQQAALEEAEFERAFNARAELAIFEQEQLGNLEKAAIARRNLLLLNQELTEDERKLIIAKSEAEISDIRKKAEEKRIADQKAAKDAQIALEREAIDAARNVFDEYSVLGKTAALVDIAYSQGQAIAGLIANAERNPAGAITFGAANALHFGAGLLRIGAAIQQALKIINSKGPSSSVSQASVSAPTSASVPSGLANVNATLLSQFGDQARNDQQNTQDVVNGVSNLPPIFVSVEEINRGQNRLETKVKEANLGG